MHYWLFKSEPTCFSIDDLAARPKQTEHWDGIRNYQVRNMLRDEIKQGDQAFFYHSSCPIPAIVGRMEIVKNAYPDPTAWDIDSEHFDPKSSLQHPRWLMVDVKLIEKFSSLITLAEIKKHSILSNMLITKKGNRLSITSVTNREWETILALSHRSLEK